MSVDQIVSQIDAEIARLQQVRKVLTSTGNGTRAKKAAKPTRRRKLSAEARERIAAAQRKRWAKQKRAR